MAEPPNQTDSIFPVLDAAQVEHLASFSPPRCARQREILFDHGDERHGVFIVVKGNIEILGAPRIRRWGFVNPNGVVPRTRSKKGRRWNISPFCLRPKPDGFSCSCS